MDKFSKSPKDTQSNRIAFEGGSYSLAVTALVLAILIVVNILANALPASLTKLDISSSKLYSVTSNTKAVLNSLQEDVTLYWITQAGEEDEVIENLLSKYDALSDHVEVVKKNPDIYPTFAEQYTSDMVKNNSLVVECGDKNRFIGYDDIYLQQTNLSHYSYDTSFDGEGAITSAIDYVVSDNQPFIYLLEGHGEAPLPEAFQKQLEKANMEVKNFSLLTVEEIPEEAACIMIYAPTSDISAEEKEMLHNYAESGGKLLVMAGPVPDVELTNLYSLLKDYGVETKTGVVVEADKARYAFRAPYALMAEAKTNEITDPLIAEHYYPIVPIAQGMTIGTAPDGVTITELLASSATSFNKEDGFNISTYDKEEGDVDGPFTVGLTIDTKEDGQIIWYSSSLMLDDMYNAYSSGANIDLTLNSLGSLVGESEAMAIRSKSLNYNYLTISESTASLLKVLMIGVFPIVYLGIGVIVVLRRKEKQNSETL